MTVKGAKLDIGEFPSADGTDKADADPTRPMRLTAHAVARVADRLPFSRRISRHMEGTDNRAGIFSDILALITELVKRNPDLIESRLEAFGDELSKARQQREEQRAAKQTTTGTEGNTNHAA